MKYIDEFRAKALVIKTAGKIKKIAPLRKIRIMEVCGTHTHNFRRFALGKFLPAGLEFISGPGCPVCVSHEDYIDATVQLARLKDVIIATFGDMLRIPGRYSSLEKERSGGSEVSVVYSPLDALELARQNPKKKVVFLGVGFETTAPAIALSIIAAKKKKIKNISFLTSLKLMPPAMQFLLKDKKVDIDAFLCPGHVSSIIGTKPYEFIAKRYKIPCCVAGFEPLDILEGIYLILNQIIKRKPVVSNQYIRVVKKEGNPKAVKIIYKVFQQSSADWRGLGRIPQSGLKIKSSFSKFDAENIFSFKPTAHSPQPRAQCKCGDVLKGLLKPPQCPLFAKVCLPQQPVGPCMVSAEGACNAYYKYR